jgi:hypothetical protein
MGGYRMSNEIEAGEYSELPIWLQQLWDANPSIARAAEEHIKKINDAVKKRDNLLLRVSEFLKENWIGELQEVIYDFEALRA